MASVTGRATVGLPRTQLASGAGTKALRRETTGWRPKSSANSRRN